MKLNFFLQLAWLLINYHRNTKVIGGRNYIDLSGERESDSVQLKEVHSDLDKAEDAMVTLVAEDLQERIRMASPPQSAGLNLKF